MAKETVRGFRITEELWRKFRAYAIMNGLSTKELLEYLIRKELAEQRAVKELRRAST